MCAFLWIVQRHIFSCWFIFHEWMTKGIRLWYTIHFCNISVKLFPNGCPQSRFSGFGRLFASPIVPMFMCRQTGNLWDDYSSFKTGKWKEKVSFWCQKEAKVSNFTLFNVSRGRGIWYVFQITFVNHGDGWITVTENLIHKSCFCRFAGKWRNNREREKAETLNLSEFPPFIA